MTLLTSCGNEEVYDNTFYSADHLFEMSLTDLKAIPFKNAKLQGNYLYGNIEQAEYDEYVEYLYNYLNNQTNLYVGSRIDYYQQLHGVLGTTDYIKEVKDLRDYRFASYYPNGYKFFYIDKNENHVAGDYINKAIELIKYENSHHDSELDYNYNFYMSVGEIAGISRYYLLDEFYDTEYVDITNDNFSEYLEVFLNYYGGDHLSISVGKEKVSYPICYLDMTITYYIGENEYSEHLITGDSYLDNALYIEVDKNNFSITDARISAVDVHEAYILLEKHKKV